MTVHIEGRYAVIRCDHPGCPVSNRVEVWPGQPEPSRVLLWRQLGWRESPAGTFCPDHRADARGTALAGRASAPARLDPRLLAAGLAVSVRLLAEVVADHWPYDREPGDRCASCGHVFTSAAPECPSSATARPLLWSRRNEVTPTPLRDFPRAGLDLAHPPKCGEQLPRPRPGVRRPRPAAQPDSLFELVERR